jgi:hypothetical protein
VLFGRNVVNATLWWPLILTLSAVAQNSPRRAPAAQTPARINTGEEPFHRLAHPVQIHTVDSLSAPPKGDVPLPEKLALARNAGVPASSPEANGVLESATKLCRKFVKLDLSNFDSKLILTRTGEDVLVSWGHLSGDPQGISNFLLWDEPVSTSLLLQIPPQKLQTPALLEDLLAGMFIWGEGNLESVFIDWSAATHPGQEALRGSAFFRVIHQVNVERELTISGYSDGAEAWLSITLAKNLGFQLFEHDMIRISERFPPLRTRVPQWTTSQLLAAIGQGGKAENRYDKAFERDRVLLEELMRRPDFTASAFQDLLDRDLGTGPSMGDSLPGAILVAAQSGDGARFIPVMLAYFQGLQLRGRPVVGSETYWLMFKLNRGARPEFCELAVGLLNSHLAVELSQEYTAKFCRR